MHLKGLSVRKNKAMYFAIVNITYSENSFVHILLTMKENEKDDSFSPLLIGTEYYQLVHSKSKCNKQPRFSWSLIYEKHRRFAPRPGRVAPKSDTSNTKKEPLFVGSPRLIIFVLLCINN